MITVRQTFTDTAQANSDDAVRQYQLSVLVTFTPDEPVINSDVCKRYLEYAIGGTYPYDPTARVKAINVSRRDNHPYLFDATIDYATDAPADDPVEPTTPPWDRPADEDWGFIEREKPFEKDRDGNAVLNSAGEPFDPPSTETLHLQTLTLSWNASLNAFSEGVAADFIDTVNETQYRHAAAKHAWIRDIRHQKVHESGVTYWSITAEIVFDRSPEDSPFDKELLDQGYAEKNDDGKLVTMKDAEGNPFNAPQLLDGQGKRLEAEADPVYLGFREKEVAEFNNLLPI